jgi:KDO2-lipid IV(A) lauroyltransferase
MYALYLGLPLPVEPTFDMPGRRKMRAVLDRGQGIIIATGHLGFWSLGPFLMERFGLGSPVVAMAEEPNANVQAFDRQFRQQWRVVYTTGSPFATLELAAALRRNEMVAMQLDRLTGGPSLDVPFCGRAAHFPVGLATLGRATRAPIMPVFMVRDGARSMRVFMEDPIEVAHTRDRDEDVRAATATLVGVYERYVRRYPYQWFNFHDFWAPPGGFPSSSMGGGLSAPPSP